MRRFQRQMPHFQLEGDVVAAVGMMVLARRPWLRPSSFRQYCRAALHGIDIAIELDEAK